MRTISNPYQNSTSWGLLTSKKSDFSACNYQVFGVKLHNRDLKLTGIIKDYSMGFQGQLEDDEIKGEGNSINYESRMHDPRIGRFFTLDPLSDDYPWNSPYAFSENRVIDAIEINGEKMSLLFETSSDNLFEPNIDNKPVLTVLNTSGNNYSEPLFNNGGDDDGGDDDECDECVDLEEIVITAPRISIWGIIIKRGIVPAGKWVIKNIKRLWTKTPKKAIKNPYLKKGLDQLLKDKNSYKKLIKEHKQKLKDFKKNPDKYDNKGLLKNKTKAERDKIIKGRIKSIEKQIKKQEGELKKIEKAIKTKT